MFGARCGGGETRAQGSCASSGLLFSRPTGPGSRKGSSLSLALHSEPPGRERKVSHCQHPPTNRSGDRVGARGGAANVHLFTALGSRSPRLRCPASPRMQTDSLLGVPSAPHIACLVPKPRKWNQIWCCTPSPSNQVYKVRHGTQGRNLGSLRSEKGTGSAF